MGNQAALLAPSPGASATVDLVEWDPDGERKVAASALYPHVNMPERDLRTAVWEMSESEIDDIFSAYVGNRANRRHKPGLRISQQDHIPRNLYLRMPGLSLGQHELEDRPLPVRHLPCKEAQEKVRLLLQQFRGVRLCGWSQDPKVGSPQRSKERSRGCRKGKE